MSTDNSHNIEPDNDKSGDMSSQVKRNWIVNYHDKDLIETGPDIGGGPIYEYKGKRFTGIIREYRPDGSLIEEISCLRGFPEGLRREYHPNGLVMQETYITHNWNYGPITEWDTNGNIIYDKSFGFDLQVKKWILAIDVYYHDNTAKVVGVLFNQFKEDEQQFYVEYAESINEYIPGEFYKRELPCILEILKQVDLKRVFMIIVDGHVYVDNEENYGLGGKLWEQLDGEIPVIGAAKTKFARNTETVREVYRGESKNPLYVSTIGMDVSEAAKIIAGMKGSYRMPDILKTIDQETRSY